MAEGQEVTLAVTRTGRGSFSAGPGQAPVSPSLRPSASMEPHAARLRVQWGEPPQALCPSALLSTHENRTVWGSERPHQH